MPCIGRRRVFAGTANVGFASHDGDLADLALGARTVALQGQVNNFAEAALAKTGAGTLTRSGNTWTLDLGTLAVGAGDRIASLAVLNSAIGPADVLGGEFDLAGSAAASRSPASARSPTSSPAPRSTASR